MDYTYVSDEEDYFTESNEDEFLIDQIRCEQENPKFSEDLSHIIFACV